VCPAVRPALMLVDEPTAGLSPTVTDEVYRTLRDLRDWEAKTILLVDQNVRKALEIADHVYVLELGRNKLDAPPQSWPPSAWRAGCSEAAGVPGCDAATQEGSGRRTG
jgi:ABC-type branched-subunit amino acid transport system ATPase component